MLTHRSNITWLAGLVLLALTNALSGCSEPDQKAEVVSKSAKPTAPRKRVDRSHDNLRRFVSCDGNVKAKSPQTSCPFAENVFWAYWSYEKTRRLKVWSPTVQETFTVRCRQYSSTVRCTTPEHAVVRIRAAAIDAYTQSDADRYATGHDLGPDPDYGNTVPGAGTEPEDPAPGDPGPNDDAPNPSNCEPGYSPCLDSGAGDYDCAGGQGNGPNYTGTVNVSGSDPFDLDRDGDGIGCE